MQDEEKIYRVARELVDKYGAGAWTRVADLLEVARQNGASKIVDEWTQILKVIEAIKLPNGGGSP